MGEPNRNPEILKGKKKGKIIKTKSGSLLSQSAESLAALIHIYLNMHAWMICWPVL